MTTGNEIYGCGENTEDNLELENKTEPENFLLDLIWIRGYMWIDWI